MKKRIKPVRFALFLILVLGIGLGLFAFADADKSFYFEIPTTPFDVSGDFDNIRNEFIYCLAGQKNDIIDNSGNVIATESSAFFGGNPWTTFSLVDDKTGKNVEEGGFDVKVEFKCQTSGQALPESGTDPNSFDFLNFPSVEIPLTVKSGELFVKVYSRNAEGGLIETWNGKLPTKETKITSPESNILGNVRIQHNDILKYLPAGEYQSWQHITVEGNIDVYWTGYPNTVYRYTIENDEQFSGMNLSNVDGDLITYRLINVDIPIDQEKPDEEPADCTDKQIFVNGFCITKSNGGVDSNVDLTTFNPLGETGERFNLCMQAQGFGCLFHQEFIGYTLFGLASFVGLGVVVIFSKNSAQGVSANQRYVYGMGY